MSAPLNLCVPPSVSVLGEMLPAPHTLDTENRTASHTTSTQCQSRRKPRSRDSCLSSELPWGARSPIHHDQEIGDD